MTIICVLDTETTGLSNNDKIVEFATVRINTDKTNDDYYWSVKFNPKIPIPPEASAVHHITDKDVAGLEEFSILDWHDATASAEILCAHNADFDKKFLPSDQRPWICTYKTSLQLWQNAPAWGNQTLRYWRKFDLNLSKDLHPHSALYDAITTTGILRSLLEDASIEDLVKISLEPPLLQICRFGKYKDWKYKDIPSDYLNWINQPRDKDQFEESVLHTAKYWLAQRNL